MFLFHYFEAGAVRLMSSLLASLHPAFGVRLCVATQTACGQCHRLHLTRDVDYQTPLEKISSWPHQTSVIPTGLLD